MSSAKKLVLFALACAAVVACGIELAERNGAGAPPPPDVVTEHRFLSAPASSAKGALGADCAEFGSSACASGICLHVGLGIHEGFICSARCEGNADCPAGLACGGAADARFCVPELVVAPAPYDGGAEQAVATNEPMPSGDFANQQALADADAGSR